MARREAELVERQRQGYCLAEEMREVGGVGSGLGPAGIGAHRKPLQPGSCSSHIDFDRVRGCVPSALTM